MAVKMVKVVALHDGLRYGGVPYRKGDSLEIPEHMLQEWLGLGHVSVSPPPPRRPAPLSEDEELRRMIEEEQKMAPPVANKMAERAPNKALHRDRRPVQSAISFDDDPEKSGESEEA